MNPKDPDAELERVIVAMRPVTEKILARYRRAVLPPEDVDDIAATVDLRLLEKLRGAAGSDEEPIQSLENYVAKLTYNAINDHLRRRFPRRARLKARLRRALTNEPRLAMWASPRGTACGLREWTGMDRIDESIAARTIRFPQQAHQPDDPGEALLAVLGTIGKPVLFDDLVGLIAGLWNVVDSDAAGNDPNEQKSEEQTAIERLIERDDVELLWREIRQLLPMQRQALLLGLRYGGSMDIVATLTLGGLATFDEVAATLEMSPGDLAAIWSSLPLDDLKIAEMLRVTRQQVINLRRSARERLARRFPR
jgi:DNA-directed RNA polymerase specialized sigma24 family protein